MPNPPMRGLGPRGFLTEEEKENLPKVDKALMKRILSYLLPYRIQHRHCRHHSGGPFFTMSWKLAIVGILIIPLLILPTKKVGKTQWKIRSDSQEKNDELNQLINESLSGKHRATVSMG